MRRARWVVVLLFGAACGCGDHQDQQQLDLAAQSVQASLATWKRGDEASSLASGPQPIEFHDDDWKRSSRLVDYEILMTYLDTDGEPRCAVKLTVQAGDDSPKSVSVTYQVVQKDSTVVIARDPMS